MTNITGPQRIGRSGGRNDTRRWIVMIVVLVGSLGVYMIERWTRTPHAPVVGRAFVVDGDSLAISGTRIRLADIDAPELDQTCRDTTGKEWPCGRQAAEQLRSRIDDQELTCRPQAVDQYKRVVATCTLPDGSNINAWLVQQGLAVTFGHVDVYGEQQADAKSSGRGLWAGMFIAPSEWRKQHPRKENGKN